MNQKNEVLYRRYLLCLLCILASLYILFSMAHNSRPGEVLPTDISPTDWQSGSDIIYSTNQEKRL